MGQILTADPDYEAYDSCRDYDYELDTYGGWYRYYPGLKEYDENEGRYDE